METSLKAVTIDEAAELVSILMAPSDVDDEMKRDPQKTVLCAPCNLWFGNVLDFIRHHSQHESQTEFLCLLCKHSFTTRTDLLDHYENFHHIDVVPAPAALSQSRDKDLTTHVDHSYFRAEDGEKGETGVMEHNVEEEKEEEEGILKEEESMQDVMTEMLEEVEAKTEMVQEGDEKIEMVGGTGETTEVVEGAENTLKDITNDTEQVIQQPTVGDETDDCLNAVSEIENEKVAFCHAELADMDSNNEEKKEGEIEDDSSQIPSKEDEMSNSVGSGDDGDVALQKETQEEEEGKMMEQSDDALDARTSPYDDIAGEGSTLDSIHSDQLEDDSNTFMEQIHLETGETGECFESSFSDDNDEHGTEIAHAAEENMEEMVPEYEEGDFRFISGLRHRQIHIANTNLVTDIGTQVFICLHCDFIDSEAGLVNHMKKTHEQILEVECRILDYQREVPEDRVFPENITGEEVIRLSEYHSRNLEQKHLSSRSGKRTARTDGVREKGHHVCINKGGTPEKKKRYVENRMPCLCPECGKILCRKSALRTHILGVHSRSRNHLCEVCGKAFRAAYHLSQHRKSHRTKTFSCDLCEFTSDVRMDIFDHQQLHPNKFILCHVCGTVLKSKTALTRHMMVHSESRPFACTVEGCTWRFTSEALCKGHIESHNSPGEFICLECKRRFRKRHHIRRHLKTVHGKVSNCDADKFVAVDAKVVPSTEQFGQIPVTQLSKQHIVITTDEHGTPIFCDQNDELVFDSKTSSLLQVTMKHSDGI